MPDRQGQQRFGPLVGVRAVLLGMGIDPSSVFALAGLDPTVRRTQESIIPFAAQGRLLRHGAAAAGREDFGLLVGQRTYTRSLGLIGQLMCNAQDLGGALRDLTSNQHRYASGGLYYLLERGETALLGYAVYETEAPDIEYVYDAYTALAAGLIKELAGLTPDHVLLSRKAPSDPAPYHNVFGVMPQFDAEQSAIVFARKDLATAVSKADPVLRQALEPLVALYNVVEAPDIAERVTRLLRPEMVSGGATLRKVADKLSLHPRTLNRRLEETGTTFRRLVNETRFETASQFLASTNMTITEVALSLGYADTSAFTHAFHNHSMTAPSAWRADHARAAVAST